MSARRLDGLVFRSATAADAPRLAELLVEGFETYRAFAPEGFQVPQAEDVAESMAERLETPQVWCRLAEDGTGVAGYVSLLPAADSRKPVDDPALAHFWMLFVRALWWGSGLATELHRAALAAATDRHYNAMRLFTPAEQARARGFYEREGWTVAGRPYLDEDLGIAVVEYRRPVTGSTLRA